MKVKSTSATYLLCILPSLIGIAGIHRFYLGKIGTGIIYLLTFGLFGFGIIYDLFTIPKQVRMANLLLNGTGFMQANQNQNVIVNVHTGQAPVVSSASPEEFVK